MGGKSPPCLRVIGINREDSRDLVRSIVEKALYPLSHIVADPEIREVLPNVAASSLCKTQGDVYLVLGGDGTFLRAAHKAAGRPLAGVNLGSLGFLSLYTPEDLPLLLHAIRTRDYTVEHRTALDVSLSEESPLPAYNDVVIRSAQPSKLIRVEALVGQTGEVLFDFYADGMIVSTPTGSTAYNLSVMGPVVHPSVDAMVITPLAAHTLSARPILLPGALEIHVRARSKYGENLLAVIDGNWIHRLPKEGFLKVTSGPHAMGLVRTAWAPGFVDILRQKLGWGGQPR